MNYKSKFTLKICKQAMVGMWQKKRNFAVEKGLKRPFT